MDAFGYNPRGKTPDAFGYSPRAESSDFLAGNPLAPRRELSEPSGRAFGTSSGFHSRPVLKDLKTHWSSRLLETRELAEGNRRRSLKGRPTVRAQWGPEGQGTRS